MLWRRLRCRHDPIAERPGGAPLTRRETRRKERWTVVGSFVFKDCL